MALRLLPLTSAVLVTSASIAYTQTVDFSSVTYSSLTGARDALAVDINGDGWLDIATANTGSNVIALLINRGDGSGFEAVRTIPAGAGAFDIDSGDLNRDGIQDLEEVKRHLKRQNVVVDAWIDPRDYSIQSESKKAREGEPEPQWVTIQTDYLILGNGSEAITNVRDRLEAGRTLDANITKLKDQSKEYGVETMSISRYLKNIGFGF